MQTIKVKDLGSILRQVRRAKRLTLGVVAEETNLSIITLSKIEQAAGPDKTTFEPSIKTVIALADWLKVPVETFLYGPPGHFNKMWRD